MNKKFLFMMFAPAFLFSMSSCDKKNDGAMQETPLVKLATVKSEAIQQEEVYTATVESDVKNNIAPNMAYRIQKIYVDVGDVVRKGQAVVQLDVANQDQLSLQIQSQIAQAQSQIAQMQNQEAEFKRTAELYKMVAFQSQNTMQHRHSSQYRKKLLLYRRVKCSRSVASWHR